jgi:drug/metabolite transporter (DMT)-like permease
MSEAPSPRSRRLRADAVLVAVTAVWGSSFVVVKNVLEVSPPFGFLFWGGVFLRSVLYLGSIGAVGTFLGQTWAQRQMSATHAAILFTLEPVFAALLAAWMLGERLGPRGFAGGVLVLAGIVVSEVRLRGKSSILSS